MTKARTTSPLTRNQKKKMNEVPSEVKLRKVVPEVPRDEAEWGELLEDLQVMGCSGFLEKPWGFKDDRIVRELLDEVSNEFDNSIRGQPIRWTEECWKEVYHFSKGGGGLAGRKDEYVKDCFKDLPSPKDGYSIEDCKDPRHRRLLAFPGLSRVRTSTAASGGRPDASDDPTDVRRRTARPSSEAVRRRRMAAPFAGGRPQLPSTGSRLPPPSALYDSNFSFLHYVFVSLIVVT
jgi:hypothetical protein